MQHLEMHIGVPSDCLPPVRNKEPDAGKDKEPQQTAFHSRGEDPVFVRMDNRDYAQHSTVSGTACTITSCYGEYTVFIGRLEHEPAGLHTSPSATLQRPVFRPVYAALLGAFVTAGCESPRKPAPPLADNTVHAAVQIAEDSSLSTIEDMVDEYEETSSLQQMPERHEDIFDPGDRNIVLGTDAWVTLADGRQAKTVYSADGSLISVNDVPFEMWSKTKIGLSFRSRITVQSVTIRDGGQELVITGSARGLTGETVFSRDGLQKFVERLSSGQEPEFPVSTVASSGFIMKHEKQEDSE